MSKIFSITEGLENLGALRTGGQGSVYKGRRMSPLILAVKVLPTPIHSEDDEDKNFRNFQNEVEKLKKVNEEPNPNVVKILNSGLTESGSLPFIEMEFIEGPDLEELLKPPHDSIFTLKEVIKAADHLANALAHCHKAGVKHGDIKSNNVKYNIYTGNYVLLDFGLSIMSDEQRRTSMRHAGAIEFMAPEQNTGAMLFQTDIYSYGIILYELLAGQVPFPLQDSGETARNGVMIAHMESPVPDVLELRKKNLPDSWPPEKQEQEMRVPQWLLQLMYTCLEKAPENRYSDGLALQVAFCNAVADPGLPNFPMDSFIALTAENAALAAQLAACRQSGDGSQKQGPVSKIYFAAIIAALMLIVTLGSYAIFSRSAKATPPQTDTALNLPVTPVHQTAAPLKPVKKKAATVADTSDSSLVERHFPADTGLGQQAVVHHPRKKKHPAKKKKFLGIF